MYITKRLRAVAMLLAFVLAFGSLGWLPVQAQTYEDDGLFFVQDMFADEDFISYVEAHVIENFGYEFMTNHRRSLMTADTVFESFPRNRMDARVYPATFGGLYIDDCGNLVILTVNRIAAFAEDMISEMTEEVAAVTVAFVDTLDNAFQADAGVTSRNVDFSFGELMEAITVLEWFLMEQPEVAFRNAQTWYLDVIGNRVVVELIDYSAEEINRFRQDILDSPVLLFRESTGNGVVTINIPEPTPLDETEQELVSIVPFNITSHPGSATRPYLGNRQVGSGSIAYRARLRADSSIVGFVTAAHTGPINWGGWGGQSAVYAIGGQTRIGNVHMVALQGFDAAFVRNHSGHTVSNQLPRLPDFVPGNYDRFHQARYADVIQGGLVFRVGMPLGSISIRLSSGRVTGLNRAVEVTSQIHSTFQVTAHLANFSPSALGGESGGLVFREIIPSTHPAHMQFGVAGITVGTGGVGDAFVCARRINQHLGLVLF